MYIQKINEVKKENVKEKKFPQFTWNLHREKKEEKLRELLESLLYCRHIKNKKKRIENRQKAFYTKKQ